MIQGQRRIDYMKQEPLVRLLGYEENLVQDFGG